MTLLTNMERAIARCLAERGFDVQVAVVFIREAQDRGRLNTQMPLGEAIEVVASMMMPRGVWYESQAAPRKSAGGRQSIANPPVLSHGTWMIT